MHIIFSHGDQEACLAPALRTLVRQPPQAADFGCRKGQLIVLKYIIVLFLLQ